MKQAELCAVFVRVGDPQYTHHSLHSSLFLKGKASCSLLGEQTEKLQAFFFQLINFNGCIW